MENHQLQLRIGNRSLSTSFSLLNASSADDSLAFETTVTESVKANPDEPLVIAIDGYAPWLDDLLGTCIETQRSSPASVARDVIHSQAVQLPQSSNRRAGQVPWIFIVDEINLPEVWKWTFGKPQPEGGHASSIDNYRFRIGAWVCDQGAYLHDVQIPVVIVFTRPTSTAEDIVTNLVFPHIFKAAALYDDRAADDAVCWVFYALYNLLTDWQNIVGEVGRKLNQAEIDSNIAKIPIKQRTRNLHKEVDRIYEIHEYLRFHSRCFKKLAKFTTLEASHNNRVDSIWEVMDDMIGDLEQYETYLDSMKERFSNLIELQFNLESALQSDNARFISILGALFLPVSFLASLFGINTVHWAWPHYFYMAIPLFFLSLALTFALPAQLAAREDRAHPVHVKRIQLQQKDFTLLGDIDPESAKAPGIVLNDASSMASSNSSGAKYDENAPLSKSFKPSERPTADRNPSQRSVKARSNSTQSGYGVPRTAGLVGSRRKQLDDSKIREERARAREMDVEALGSMRRRSKSTPTS